LHKDHTGKQAFPPLESSSCLTSERHFLNHVATCFDSAKKAESELLRSFWVSFSKFKKRWLVGFVLFYFFFFLKQSKSVEELEILQGFELGRVMERCWKKRFYLRRWRKRVSGL